MSCADVRPAGVRVELVMGERKAYPSDLTDDQWAVVGPFLDAWKAKHPSVSGHQGRYSLREILNSIFDPPRKFRTNV